MRIINKIVSFRLFYGIVSIAFVFLNYSFVSWDLFNKIGGLALAKSAPEIIGIIFFLVFARIYLKRFYPKVIIQVTKRDVYAVIFFLLVAFIFRYKQFYTYFFRDDFYFWLNRLGTGYSVYEWGRWLSSHPGWLWETVRNFAGYDIFWYQLAAVLSHILLAIGVYFLSKYLSKNYYVGLISSLFVLTTTISFEAFEWLSHPISFGWQGFFVCLALIALVWEIEKNKGKRVPYLSAFIIMPAFGSGIARIGFILPLVSAVIFLVSINFFSIKRVFVWLRNLLINQWIFYIMVFIFFWIRNLWTAGGTKTEVITAPLYRIYLYVVGIFVFPVEIFGGISKLSKSTVQPGYLTVVAGMIFLVLFILFFAITKLKKKPFPVILSVGFFWLTLSSLYYTLFAPHLPATDNEINISLRTHHLSYLGSVGSLMIWGFVFYKILAFLQKIRKPIGHFVVGALVVGYFVISYVLLSRQYDIFLDFAKGTTITRQQFFFDTYRKYISANADKVNIFYDDGASKRKDNYKPNEYYFWAFWDQNKVRIFWGDADLKDYLAKIKDKDVLDTEINNLHYIYTDYDDGLIAEDLSPLLRDSIHNPKSRNILQDNWNLYWGKKDGGLFLPEIVTDRNINYFKNPVLVADRLSFPSVLTPRLKITLNVQKVGFDANYTDLRAGVFSQLLNSWTLPSKDQTSSLVRYYFDNPSQSVLAFNDLLNSVHVNDKMVCGQKTDNDGITFLVVWMGEPDTYHSKNESKDLLTGYLDRYYSICYFPGLTGYKTIDIDLPNLGSILRRIVILPLTGQPISVELIDSSLSVPKILK